MTQRAADNLALALPVLLPMLTAMACLAAGSGRARQRLLGLGGAALHLGAAIWLMARVVAEGVVVSQLGGWPAPFGIALAGDRLGAMMLVLASIVTGACSVFAAATLEHEAHLARFMRLSQLMLAGMSGLFLTGDLFNFYVWFELILVCSFGLMVVTGSRSSIEGATKYVAMNIVGSMLLLSAAGLLYAMTGTLNMADLARRLPLVERPHLATAVGAMLIVALGVKSAAFPLFFWLPASYHTPPIAVTALFGGLLTKVGVYGLLRLFTLVFTGDVAYTHTILLVAGALTMITGVLGAVAQHDLRRLLSFHIISQIGYMLIALGFATETGVAAAMVFMVHIVITKTALLLVAGLVDRAAGSFDLDKVGGLYAHRPALALLFLLPALSLGGLPPFSGFIAKLSVIESGLAAQQYAAVAAAVAVSLLTLYSMVKIWTHAFWAPAEEAGGAPPTGRLSAGLWLPTAGLVVLLVAAGLGGRWLAGYCALAAEGLANPQGYIEAVLGEVRP